MKFKIGDAVKILPWEVLEKKYGLDVDGDIKTPTYYLSKTMYELFKGRSVTVVEADTDETIKVMRDDGFALWFPYYVLDFADKEKTEESHGPGTADSQEHYKKSAMQPIEVMQTFLSPEQFKGFLLGNFIKYSMRANFKGQYDSDRGKAKQYAYWYHLVKTVPTGRINPATDVPPADFKVEGVFG